jgi:hypothetical protein
MFLGPAQGRQTSRYRPYISHNLGLNISHTSPPYTNINSTPGAADLYDQEVGRERVETWGNRERIYRGKSRAHFRCPAYFISNIFIVTKVSTMYNVQLSNEQVLRIGIVFMPIRSEFPFDANPDLDPDPDGHQNDADPHADPSLSFTQVEK